MYLPFKISPLDLPFDLSELSDDLSSIGGDNWHWHGFYGSGHFVAPLVTERGVERHPDGSCNHSFLGPFQPTPLLRRLPNTAKFLSTFAPACRAKFLRVPAGCEVAPHQDRHPYWRSKLTIHVPLVTNAKVLFNVWDEDETLPESARISQYMDTTSAWIFNTQFYHGVTNSSQEDRIHLCIDADLTDFLLDMVFGKLDRLTIKSWLAYEYPYYDIPLRTPIWATGNRQMTIAEFSEWDAMLSSRYRSVMNRVRELFLPPLEHQTN